MSDNRISKHPIVKPLEKKEIVFFFKNKPYKAYEGEMISTALFANDIKIFGNHHKDNSPQGLFCANGQCSQCLLIADGRAVKSCIEEVKENMKIESIEGFPELPADDRVSESQASTTEVETEVLIMGGGPSGLAAAIELGKLGVKTIIADDKNILGGKLGLQTHNFFGSARECNAGVRGMDIGTLLTEEVNILPSVDIWLNAPVVAVFSDKKIGIIKDNKYVLLKPKIFLVAAGAREKALAFPGSDLPGVYGAGAFQTLVNRDLVKASKSLFILGGGNVGLIAAYHALQAGIDVLGLVEALPECGGYKVHLDKIKRLGVPIWTSHTVLRAEGNGKLESIIITKIDKYFKPISGSELKFDVDTLLIAVGLSPVNEMLIKAQEYGIKTYGAGDADIIAEASAAIFSGKIVGRKILQDMGHNSTIPPEWNELVNILRSKPGETMKYVEFEGKGNKTYPIIRCTQEIPCNPCTEACVNQAIQIKSHSMMITPSFEGKCLTCGKCVSICPGLSITLVDETYDENNKKAQVIIPWELPQNTIQVGEEITTTGFEGEVIGKGKVLAIRESQWQDRRQLVYLETPLEDAKLVASIRIIEPKKQAPQTSLNKEIEDDDVIICRCERITKKQIIDKIKSGCNDFNALKAELRTGMGPCGGKTCIELISRIFRECGVDKDSVEKHVYRPFELEVPLKAFIKDNSKEKI